MRKCDQRTKCYKSYYGKYNLKANRISVKIQLLFTAIQKSFADCTIRINVFGGEMFGNLKSICENEEKYLQCWDQLKEDITTKCHQTGHLPAVYAATVKSLCGNDKGNTTISKENL